MNAENNSVYKRIVTVTVALNISHVSENFWKKDNVLSVTLSSWHLYISHSDKKQNIESFLYFKVWTGTNLKYSILQFFNIKYAVRPSFPRNSLATKISKFNKKWGQIAIFSKKRYFLTSPCHLGRSLSKLLKTFPQSSSWHGWFYK